jgi:hypothetical protein
LAVVDRAELDFEVGKFFVWQAPDGQVIIRWFNAVSDVHVTCSVQRVKTIVAGLFASGVVCASYISWVNVCWTSMVQVL